MSSAAGDRRPIASRERPIFQAMAAWLIARRASPNAISIAGLIAAIAAGACLWATARVEPLPARLLFGAAAGLVQLRLLANMLDGMVAVGRGIASRVGELYNEVPDRIADAAALIGLGYAAGGSPELGYLAAILAVFCAYIRAVGKAAGAGSDFCGPMAKQQRMFTVTVAALYLALAPASWHARSMLHEAWGIPAAALVLIIVGTAYTCLRRVAGIAAKLRRASAPMP
jgi:phosphatidylglycerophosphate synthase